MSVFLQPGRSSNLLRRSGCTLHLSVNICTSTLAFADESTAIRSFASSEFSIDLLYPQQKHGIRNLQRQMRYRANRRRGDIAIVLELKGFKQLWRVGKGQFHSARTQGHLRLRVHIIELTLTPQSKIVCSVPLLHQKLMDRTILRYQRIEQWPCGKSASLIREDHNPVPILIQNKPRNIQCLNDLRNSLTLIQCVVAFIALKFSVNPARPVQQNAVAFCGRGDKHAFDARLSQRRMAGIVRSPGGIGQAIPNVTYMQFRMRLKTGSNRTSAFT